MLPFVVIMGSLALLNLAAFSQTAEMFKIGVPAALAKALPKAIRPAPPKRSYSGADLKASGKMPASPARRSQRLSNE